MAGPRVRVITWLAGQLRNPHGVATPVIALMLNRSNAGAIGQAVNLLGLADGEVAADLGFGGGLGLMLLLEKVGSRGNVHGVDYSSDAVKRAASRFRNDVGSGRLTLHEASITRLPLNDQSIDGAITINTVYFIAEIDRAFAEMARVLRPAGTVVIGIGEPRAMARMPMTQYGFRLRPVEDIVGAAETSGLKLLDHSRVGRCDDASHLLKFGKA